MPKNSRFEEQFFSKLNDVFVGAKIEGDSGFINLMKIKSRYYQQGVFPQLQKDIDTAVNRFPEFREELFQKLYNFFSRYFSESGSIYFRFTPPHEHVYEKIYTDDRDVMLFWKTHMLYYVKTDRIFQSMEVDLEGRKFVFDVSQLEHKKANEKRTLVFEYAGKRPGGGLKFSVTFSERGRKTNSTDIRRTLGADGIKLDEETLEQAFRLFERQSEVDYFINKNARAFLREQFDLWLYQYVFEPDNDGATLWTESRLAQIQALKSVTYNIIDFIAQFEDELVRIWNKPKFVLDSHYVITLDKITDEKLFRKIMTHKGMPAQLEEWQALGMVGEAFKLEDIAKKDLSNEATYRQYLYLPIDTRFFADIEVDILSLFQDIDRELDGWLVHSENYQALNSLQAKFERSITSIYIDPPYNTDASAIIYNNNYKDSSWLTLMENRLQLARELLVDGGILSVAIDDEEVTGLRHLLSKHFEKQVGIAAVRSNPAGRKTKGKFAPAHEYALFYGKTDQAIPAALPKSEKSLARYPSEDEQGKFSWANFIRSGSNDKRADRPKLFYPIAVNSDDVIRILQMEWREGTKEYELMESLQPGEVLVYPINTKDGETVEKNWQRGHKRVAEEIPHNEYRVRRDKKTGEINIDFKTRMDEGSLPVTWWDHSKYASANHGPAELKALFKEYKFDFPKAKELVFDCLVAAGVKEDDYSIVMDYFGGSGTTAHALIDMNRDDDGERKYIVVELGEHFRDTVLPRIKKVIFSDTWKEGKAQPGKGISHFAKYYKLEQYEDVLRHANYQDADLFSNPNENPYSSYVFLRDKKLLDNGLTGEAVMEADMDKGNISVHLERLYKGIDLAETYSCVTGKWIKRIGAEEVEFEDGSRLSLVEPDWETLRPLIWW